LCHYVRYFLVAACWIVEWLEMLSVVASVLHSFSFSSFRASAR
jgi:hypothetical protein